MAITAASLTAKVNVEGASQAKSDLEGVGQSVSSAGLSLGTLAGGAALAAGAAIVGIGVKSVQMAADFQSSMTSLVTGAGEAKSNIDVVSKGILDMAVQTGTSTKQLSDGMYQIESAGYHGAQGLDVLKASAEGAKVGNADLGTVAGAVTTVLTDYHMSASQATAVTSGLVATVAAGKTHMQDLGASMGSILPLASSIGVSFPQVGAAIATMTNSGMDAQRASQNLANALRALDAPGGAATKAMKSVGLSTEELHDTLTKKGIGAAFQDIEDHVGKKFPAGSVEYDEAMKKILGGATGLNVALMLGGKNMASFNSNVQSISASMKNGAKDVQGWADVQNDFNFKMDQAKQTFDVLMIKLGTALLPVIGQVVSWVANVVSAFMKWEDSTHGVENAMSAVGNAIKNVVGFFQQLFSGMNNPQATGISKIFQDIAKVVGSDLQPIIKQLVDTWNTQLLPSFKQLMPVLTLIAQIIGTVVVTAFGIFLSTIVGIVKGVEMMLPGIIKAFGGIVQYITGVVQVISGIIQFFVDLVEGHFDKLGADLQTIWNGIVNMFRGTWNIITGLTQAAIGLIVGYISGFVSTALSYFSNLATMAGAKVSTLVNQIISFFQSLPGKVMGALASLQSSISGFFTGLASAAYSWGAGIVQGLVNGIKSMVGAAGQAAASVVSSVKSFLGFHSPAEQGEGRYIVEWGQGMIEGFAQGVKNATPQLTQTVNQSLNVGTSQMRVSPLPVSGSNSQTIVVQSAPIYLDSRILAQGMLPQLVNQIRHNVGPKGI